jgi:hypothetical protein
VRRHDHGFGRRIRSIDRVTRHRRVARRRNLERGISRADCLDR